MATFLTLNKLRLPINKNSKINKPFFGNFLYNKLPKEAPNKPTLATIPHQNKSIFKKIKNGFNNHLTNIKNEPNNPINNNVPNKYLEDIAFFNPPNPKIKILPLLFFNCSSTPSLVVNKIINPKIKKAMDRYIVISKPNLITNIPAKNISIPLIRPLNIFISDKSFLKFLEKLCNNAQLLPIINEPPKAYNR